MESKIEDVASAESGPGEMEIGTQQSSSMMTISQPESNSVAASLSMETITPSCSQVSMEVSINGPSQDCMDQDDAVGKTDDTDEATFNSHCTSVSGGMEGALSSDDLRQFDVLDDLERHDAVDNDDEDEEGDEDDGSDYESDSNNSIDSDVPDDEIEAMLEEGKNQFAVPVQS